MPHLHHRCLISIITLFFCALFGTNTLAEEKGHEACINCHVAADPDKSEGNISLLFPQLELCLSCHKDRSGDRDHAVGIEPGPDGTGELPLVNGLISCTTCHDSHIKTAGLLRLPKATFCLACHKL
ncbi:MAG: cytochrome c3 family protein [Candidatus Polarisedimenticolaceae bacterium]|nr:cytochrome c3 family protein [Candidatus Polarisedimenticolaceae bacterium]